MSIASLSRYDTETAANIVAAAMMQLAPDPDVGDKPTVVESYAHEAADLLAELKSSVQSSRAGQAHPDIAVGNILSRELGSLLMTDESRAEALNRAGQSGRLPPSLYKVVQPSAFRQRFARLGVKKDDVSLTINSPSEVEHLLTDDVVPEARETHSIFMRSFRPGRKGPPYWLLVLTQRLGIEQNVQSAWRVYDSEVNLASAERPSDVLRAFVDVYGVEICIDEQCGKYISSETADIDGFKVKIFQPHNMEVFASFAHSARSDGKKYLVGMAFCINMTKYAAMLSRKGA